MHNRHAESTPAGASFHRGDPEMGDLPQRVRPDPDGRYTVDVHVTPDGHARVGGHLYTPEEFADILRRDPNYDGRPIRLIGCDAGANDFAPRLANELDTPVLAPNKPAWTDQHGRVFSSDYEIGPDGKVRPRIPPNGEWDTHYPDGTHHSAGDDAFTPGTHDADKHDVTGDDARARGDDDQPDTHDDDSGSIDPSDPRHPDHPEHDPSPDTETIEADDPRHGERFVDWDRPAPQHVYDPPIQAPHRDRDRIPDGNRDPDYFRPTEPNPVPAPLRDLPGHTPLHPNTAYPVINENGTRTTFHTDENGTVKWVEAEPGAKSNALPGRSASEGEWNGFNPDLGKPLLPDVKYRVPNFHNGDLALNFHTDHHGQPDAVSGDLHHGGQDAAHRDDHKDKGAQRRAQMEGEAAYPADPPNRALTPQEAADARAKWAGGHLVANELGGLGEYLNMHPQMAASNSGNFRDGWVHEASWRRMEMGLSDLSRDPLHDVRDYQVRMTRGEDGVPSEVTARWREVEYKAGPDGKPLLDNAGNPIVESTVTKQRVFPNRPGVNYGPNTPYKGR